MKDFYFTLEELEKHTEEYNVGAAQAMIRNHMITQCDDWIQNKEYLNDLHFIIENHPILYKFFSIKDFEVIFPSQGDYLEVALETYRVLSIGDILGFLITDHPEYKILRELISNECLFVETECGFEGLPMDLDTRFVFGNPYDTFDRFLGVLESEQAFENIAKHPQDNHPADNGFVGAWLNAAASKEFPKSGYYFDGFLTLWEFVTESFSCDSDYNDYHWKHYHTIVDDETKNKVIDACGDWCRNINDMLNEALEKFADNLFDELKKVEETLNESYDYYTDIAKFCENNEFEFTYDTELEEVVGYELI